VAIESVFARFRLEIPRDHAEYSGYRRNKHQRSVDTERVIATETRHCKADSGKGTEDEDRQLTLVLRELSDHGCPAPSHHKNIALHRYSYHILSIVRAVIEIERPRAVGQFRSRLATLSPIHGAAQPRPQYRSYQR